MQGHSAALLPTVRPARRQGAAQAGKLRVRKGCLPLDRLGGAGWRAGSRIGHRKGGRRSQPEPDDPEQKRERMSRELEKESARARARARRCVLANPPNLFRAARGIGPP